MVASWPTCAVAQRTSMAGMVSERLMSSSMSDWQLTDARAFSARGPMMTELRNVLMPPSLEMDLVLTLALVFAPFMVTLQPVSRSCVAPANVMPVNSQSELSPARMVDG